MRYFKDITDIRYGRLVALYPIKFIKHLTYWLCKCDCGHYKIISGYNLRKKLTKSCGCLVRDTSRKINFIHGKCYSPEYKSYHHMLGRCYKKSNPKYKDYGGRGIKVCLRWKRSFKTFYIDMGNKPSKIHTLDRINNNGNYSKHNCRWTTPKQQANNKRNNKL